MTTGPLPQLSDLFIAETPATRPGRHRSAASAADAALFERFLRTAGPEQLPGPTPLTARRADRGAPRPDDEIGDQGDHRARDEVDQPRIDDRGANDHRSARPAGDPDGTQAATTTDEATSNESGTADDATSGATDELPSDGDGDGEDGSTLVDLPAGAVTALLTPAVEPDRVDVPADAVAAEAGSPGALGDIDDGNDEAPVEFAAAGDGDGSDLTDPMPVAGAGAASAAAAVVVGDGEAARLDPVADGEAPADTPTGAEGPVGTMTGADGPTTADDGVDSTVSGRPDAPVAADGADPSPEQAAEGTADGVEPDQGVTGAGAGAGADADEARPVANVVSSATGSAGRSDATPTTAVAGVENASVTAAPRNPAPTTTPASGAGTMVDGEPGEPLWLQVNRAVGSLRTLRNGEQQVTIRLRPMELGSVMVRINTGEQGTSVALVAESAVAASQLGQQRQQLVDQLEQSGLRGVAVDIGTAGDRDQAQAEAGGDGDPSSANGSGAEVAGASGGTDDGTPGFRGRRGRGASAGLVDLDL